MLRQQANRIYHVAEPTNPAIDSNPPMIPFMWLNSVSGELFSCLDNTTDTNIWIGTLGTEVP